LVPDDCLLLRTRAPRRDSSSPSLVHSGRALRAAKVSMPLLSPGIVSSGAHDQHRRHRRRMLAQCSVRPRLSEPVVGDNAGELVPRIESDLRQRAAGRERPQTDTIAVDPPVSATKGQSRDWRGEDPEQGGAPYMSQVAVSTGAAYSVGTVTGVDEVDDPAITGPDRHHAWHRLEGAARSARAHAPGVRVVRATLP
jgi:hypothetical protein